MKAINKNRIKELVGVFEELGYDKILLFDRKEPEYKFIENLHSKNVRAKYASLLGVVAGVLDFQLSKGGAEKFWKELLEVSSSFKIDSSEKVEAILRIFITKPINAKRRDIKIKRIDKIFPNFSRWFLGNFNEIRKNPLILWYELAKALNSKLEQKTIVFSMKVFDLVYLIYFGRYANFPEDIPIPVDFHIKNVGISLGIITRYASEEEVREAWSIFSKKLSNRLNRKISLLRLDSLAWQVGKILYSCNYSRKLSEIEITKYFINVGIPKITSEKLAKEFVRYVEEVKI